VNVELACFTMFQSLAMSSTSVSLAADNSSSTYSIITLKTSSSLVVMLENSMGCRDYFGLLRRSCSLLRRLHASRLFATVRSIYQAFGTVWQI
jgi:hypothetical protein